mgnify:CR=1 FL=1
MLQIFRKKDGAVSVFLTIILVPMIVVSCLFVDACRAKLAEPVVSSAGDLTLNTALTQYDATLNDYYGLIFRHVLLLRESVRQREKNLQMRFPGC